MQQGIKNKKPPEISTSDYQIFSDGTPQTKPTSQTQVNGIPQTVQHINQKALLQQYQDQQALSSTLLRDDSVQHMAGQPYQSHQPSQDPSQQPYISKLEQKLLKESIMLQEPPFNNVMHTRNQSGKAVGKSSNLQSKKLYGNIKFNFDQPRGSNAKSKKSLNLPHISGGQSEYNSLVQLGDPDLGPSDINSITKVNFDTFSKSNKIMPSKKVNQIGEIISKNNMKNLMSPTSQHRVQEFLHKKNSQSGQNINMKNLMATTNLPIDHSQVINVDERQLIEQSQSADSTLIIDKLAQLALLHDKSQLNDESTNLLPVNDQSMSTLKPKEVLKQKQQIENLIELSAKSDPKIKKKFSNYQIMLDEEKQAQLMSMLNKKILDFAKKRTKSTGMKYDKTQDLDKKVSMISLGNKDLQDKAKRDYEQQLEKGASIIDAKLNTIALKELSEVDDMREIVGREKNLKIQDSHAQFKEVKKREVIHEEGTYGIALPDLNKTGMRLQDFQEQQRILNWRLDQKDQHRKKRGQLSTDLDSIMEDKMYIRPEKEFQKDKFIPKIKTPKQLQIYQHDFTYKIAKMDTQIHKEIKEVDNFFSEKKRAKELREQILQGVDKKNKHKTARSNRGKSLKSGQDGSSVLNTTKFGSVKGSLNDTKYNKDLYTVNETQDSEHQRSEKQLNSPSHKQSSNKKPSKGVEGSPFKKNRSNDMAQASEKKRKRFVIHDGQVEEIEETLREGNIFEDAIDKYKNKKIHEASHDQEDVVDESKLTVHEIEEVREKKQLRDKLDRQIDNFIHKNLHLLAEKKQNEMSRSNFVQMFIKDVNVQGLTLFKEMKHQAYKGQPIKNINKKSLDDNQLQSYIDSLMEQKLSIVDIIDPSHQKINEQQELKDAVSKYFQEQVLSPNNATDKFSSFAKEINEKTDYYDICKNANIGTKADQHNKDPILRYFQACNKKSFDIVLPIMNKINKKQLNLFEYQLSDGVCLGMKQAFENFEGNLRQIQLDNNGLKDHNFAIILEGLKELFSIKKIIYRHNEFYHKSGEAMKAILQREIPNTLDELKIINCKIHGPVITKLVQDIRDFSRLRKLSLVKVGFNDSNFAIFCQYFQNSMYLVDLDISNNGLRGSSIQNFLEILSRNRKLQVLNISWNNLSERPPLQEIILEKTPEQLEEEKLREEEEKKKQKKEIIPQKQTKKEFGKDDPNFNQICIVKFLKYNRQLVHVNVSNSFMNKEMVQAIGTALRKANSLQVLHLGPNPGVDQEVQDYLFQRLRCKQIHKPLMFPFERHVRIMEKTLQKNDFEKIIEKQDQIHESIQLKKFNMSKTLQNKEQSKGKYSNEKLDFVRILGHKTEIPGSGQWQMHTQKTPYANCWICDQHTYCLFIWSEQIGQKINEHYDNAPQYIEEVKKINPFKVRKFFKEPLPFPEPDPDQDMQDQLRDYQRSQTESLFTIDPNEADPRFKKFILSDLNRPHISGPWDDWKEQPMFRIGEFLQTLDPSYKEDYLETMVSKGLIAEFIKGPHQMDDRQKAYYFKLKKAKMDEYEHDWQTLIKKIVRYQKPYLVNYKMIEKFGINDQLYVFPMILKPGKTNYVISHNRLRSESEITKVIKDRRPGKIRNTPSPLPIPEEEKDRREYYTHRTIVKIRQEDVPVYAKESKSSTVQRVFKKEHSVFNLWKEDTKAKLQACLRHDMENWKLQRFVKDPDEQRRVEEIITKNFPAIKSVFHFEISKSMFPCISWIDFTNFCISCKVPDNECVLATLDRLFIATNVIVAGQTAADENPDNALCRFEFLEILVRLANAKYKETGKAPSFSEALKRLIKENILANRELVWQEFRDRELWTIDVNDVMEANIFGLKKIYESHFQPRKKYMSIEDCVELIFLRTNLGIAEVDCKYAVGMSIMTCANETKDATKQYKQVQFVEFLEFIGRIADIKFGSDKSIPLAQKLPPVLDEIFKSFNVQRKEVNISIEDFSESDDDY